MAAFYAYAASGDHPRSRGVYGHRARVLNITVGSSPLARGLPAHPDARVVHGRIIPARAGFTTPPSGGHNLPRDHPRSRGVYERAARCYRAVCGSSPLARGLRAAARTLIARPGIIPARAGFTPGRRSPPGEGSDHPRSRGVYHTMFRLPETFAGSSPLARGLRRPRGRRRPGQGIIPARAGFTAGLIVGVGG